MINVGELITDRDFCQPSGISITRYVETIVNHRVSYSESNLVLQGIIIALSPNDDELLEQYDRNSEEITVLTKERLKCTGKDKVDGTAYGSDIIHYKNNDYIVRSCQDLSEYGYFRSKAHKMEQEVM